MAEDIKNEIKPFRFYTRLHLSELTGQKAHNLTELVELIKSVSGSCIYYHTHKFLQQHLYLSPEPPNDFAYWANHVLGENELGEKLASIDIISFPTIRELRETIIETIEKHIREKTWVRGGTVYEGEEFHFIKAISFIAPTNYSASTLSEFADILEKITIDSIYFHIFESRLRLEKGRNDFSQWIEASFGDKITAKNISNLDPYTYTLENLRRKLILIIRKAVKD